MSRVAKTPLFDAFNASLNCFGERQDGERTWQTYFDTTKPLVIEFGCGKAELSVELARRYPEKNFIGVDIKSDRLVRPARIALEEKLENIAFIQTDIRRVNDYLPAGSISEAWITFPDPFPRKGDAKNRMTHPRFLAIYKKLLKPGSMIRFKTDEPALFAWSLEQFTQQKMTTHFVTHDLHTEEGYEDAKVLTTFEHKWHALNKPTHYVEVSF